MAKPEEKSMDLTVQLPRFVSSKYVSENIINQGVFFEFIPLNNIQLNELKANVGEDILTPESKNLLASDSLEIPLEYGNWMYFPLRRKCIQILPKSDFIELRTSRNRLKITREEQLELSTKSIAVVGLSAGNAVANALVSERICGRLILFDFDTCELSNLNRLNAGIFELGLSKCIIAANSLLERDPYIDIEIYEEGFKNSPEHIALIEKVDVVIDECDSFEIKILLRQLSKKFNKPILMHTSERGITDIERFDLSSELPIFHGLLEGVDLEDKSKVLLSLINPGIVSERMLISFSELGKSLRSWPQLASEVFAGGANLAGIARMILLNQRVKGGRYFFNTEEVEK
jgi:hypothetical protein